MFKKQSENMQRRTVNTASGSTRNSYGIDPTALATKDGVESERRRLVEAKRGMEDRLTVINLNITSAKLQQKRPDMFAILQRLLDERAEIVKNKSKCDSSLLELKYARAEYGSARDDSFAQEFMDTAREILAGPVFDRILTATIHRSASKFDRGDKP